MAIRSGQQKRLVQDLSMFFAEKGFIPSPRDYERMPDRPRAITLRQVNRILGSWHTLLNRMEKAHPDLWEIIHKPAEEASPLEKLSAAKVED